ncbi:hypothetical protein FH972_025590 [Carpinus fangiana]|uniref:DUF1742-domain-containing protein n=1 Tax=Carpinus fangiana TaxID=176857 RepID=A0A5N6L1G4_9ROSI|nr:hypothetical protein FH972_025590 [Carpinus fangiana]
MPDPFPNTYHRRAVAPTAPKPCFICFKSTTTVLITPCNKDFFYICPGHLLDRGFAIPLGTAGVDMAQRAAAERERKRKEALAAEIEKVTAEYAERRRRRREKGKGKDGEGDAKKDKDKEKEDSKEDKERDEKIKKLEKEGGAAGDEAEQKAEEGDDVPRIFNLHKSVYQMRVNRVRQALLQKREREAVQKMGGFPAVPSGNP